MTDSDILELNQLAYRYAAAVDARDVDAFLAVFAPDARMRSYHPGDEEPFADTQGHEQLASVPKTMAAMFGLTVHQMTNHLVEVDGDTASGTVLCAARHLSVDPDDDTAVVVMIRYVDEYARRAGRWCITDRQIHFLWSERHQVADPCGRNGLSSSKPTRARASSPSCSTT